MNFYTPIARSFLH